jgi:membrane associated rhomboid family serine protease
VAVLGFADPLSLVAIGVIVASLVYSYWKKALLTFTITVACGIIFALEVASTDGFMAWPFGILGDLSLAYVRGQVSPPWTLITFQFLHASLTHLLFNLLALVLIAPVFEDRIGSLRFGVLYYVGGVLGGGAFLLLNLYQNGLVLVGASAGISSVFGAYGRLYPRDRVQLFLPLPGLPSLPVIDVVIGFLLLETALSFFGGFFGLAGIAWEAHVIAMIFGFVAAPLVMRIPSRRQRPLKPMSFTQWQALAVTPELRSILEEAERADIPEIRDAWLEKFVRAMRCPQCGGPVKMRFGRLRSPCGWRGRLG